MKLRLTLRRRSGTAADIEVTADAATTVGDVAMAIADKDPAATGLSPDQMEDLTLSVSEPTASEHTMLHPSTLVADAAIGSGFDVVTARYQDEPRKGRPSVAAILEIHSGPESGRRIELEDGHYIVGRKDESDVSIVIADPLISKRHVRIEVGSTIDLIDLNSANGVIVDGGRLSRVRAIPGQRMLIGDTEISITPHSGRKTARSGALERGGALLFNRSPRVELRYPGTDYPQPAVPTEAQQRMFPWPMVVSPVLMGLGIFALTQRPYSLMMIFLSPMMMLGNFISQRTQVNKKLKQQIETFEVQIEELEIELEDQVDVERKRRQSETPPVAEVYSESMRLGPMLWTRRPEHWNFLGLRLGTGTAPSRNTIQDPGETTSSGIPKYQKMVDTLRSRYREISGVPMMESLTNSGALGIAGDDETAADALRGIALQVFGLHAPNDVITAAIVDPAWSRRLDWMKWLPHTSTAKNPFQDMALADNQTTGTRLLNALEEAVMKASRATAAQKRGPLSEKDTSMAQGAQVGSASVPEDAGDEGVRLILFVTADAPVDRSRLTQLIERGADVGIHTVFVGPTVESLPAVCRTFVDVSQGLDHASVGYVRAGERYDDVVVEGVSHEYAHLFARRLSPVVDASTVVEDSSDLPRQVSMLSLIGHEVADSSDSVIERWHENNSIIDRSGALQPRLKRAGALTAFIGQGSPDAMTLDLRTQGPHALVGGTTGSGKSEFLQAWVLGMATEYSPDRVTFLFVDYKGGSAFADCVELPHCVGLVTDLSPHLVRRALTSLRAELHYREELFNRKKAKDLLELEKRRDPDCPPALVLVIDEFAALAGEVPEFVDGVVDIAQRGRSLGIHLIMATQRPAGVIKDNLRANTNLRVALRMADEADSMDVVGDKIAGTFDPTIPGRGIAKTGPGRLVPFQSAYAGGWSTDEEAAPEVGLADLRFGPSIVWEDDEAPDDDAHDEDLGPNDQKRMVDSFITAADRADVPIPRRPWLDELSGEVELERLQTSAHGEIVLGLADIPERQKQEPISFVPDRDGSMCVYGTSGSGKTTALRSLAASTGLGPEAGRTHVYGLDFAAGGLRSIETLPHVGSVVAGDDTERTQRLLRDMGELLDRRAKQFGEVSAASLSEYREITGHEEPRIIVLLDGFGAFRTEWDSSSARMPFYARFVRILSEGRPLGVHVVMTADRAGAVPSAVGANITKRLILRMSDETGYAVLGVPKDILDDSSLPGRGVIDGAETQIAVLGGSANTTEQARATEALGRRLVDSGIEEAPPVGALPTVYPPDELPDQLGGDPALGIADDTLAPIGFEPVGTFVVTGPPLSGKTSTLRALVTSVRRQDSEAKFFHMAGRRPQLSDFAPWTRSATAFADVKALAKELVDIVPDEDVKGRLVIVVENVTQFTDTEAERPLKELFQAVNRSEHLLIGDADVSTLSGGFGFVGDFKAGRKGIALRPDAYDGDSLFKTPFPKVKRSEFPEGRGFFVQHGRPKLVHLPLIAEDTDVSLGDGD